MYGFEDRTHGIEFGVVSAVMVDPKNTDIVWVGARGSVYRSIDSGQTWQRVFVIRGAGVHSSIEDDVREEEIDDSDVLDSVMEVVDEYREQMIDDLALEFGEELALEYAEELAEGLLDELMSERDLDAMGGYDRRRLSERYGLEPDDLEDFDTLRKEDRRIRQEEDRVYGIDLSPGGRVLLATSAGLFISFDSGSTFRDVALGIGEDDLHVFSARWGHAGEGTLYAGVEGGLWYSVDNGISFSRALGFVDRGIVRDIAVDPSDSNVVLAATEHGVFRSSDGGESFSQVWASVGYELSDIRALDFDSEVEGRVYAGGISGLIVSVDSGLAFLSVDPPGLTSMDIRHLRAWPGVGSAIVLATPVGVFASRDGALHFHESYPGLPARTVFQVAPVPGVFPDLFVATMTGLFLWKQVSEDVPSIETLETVMSRAAPLSAIVYAAMEYAEIDSAWFQKMHGRAGRSWLLPRIDGSVRLLNNYSERHGIQTGTPPRRQMDWDEDMRWEVRANWNLDAGIHSSERMMVAGSWRTIRIERDRIQDRVAASYSSWLSLSVRAMQVDSLDLLEASLLELKVRETEALLDSMTGGFFSNSMKLKR